MRLVGVALLERLQWRSPEPPGAMLLRKYDENQPRDEKGRWSPEGSLPLEQGHFTAAEGLPPYANQMQASFTKTSKYIENENQPASSMKHNLVLKLAAGLEKNPDWKAVAQKTFPLGSGMNQNPGYALANHLIATWASTSGDEHPLAIYMQHMAEKEFNMDARTSHFKESLKQVRDRVLAGGANGFPIQGGKADELDRAARAFLREQYNQTQAHLAANGIKEMFVVRGQGGGRVNSAPTVINARLQPMSSFSSNASTSYIFAGSKGVMMVGRIPASQILSTPRTGYGCKNEYEVVVLAGKMRVASMAAKSLGNHHINERLAEGARKAVANYERHLRYVEGKKSKTPDPLTTKLHKAMDEIYPDDELSNADWTKQSWDLPPYKSKEFYAIVPPDGLAQFRKLPIYQHAVARGLIVADQWVAGMHKYDESQPRDDHGRWTGGGVDSYTEIGGQKVNVTAKLKELLGSGKAHTPAELAAQIGSTEGRIKQLLTGHKEKWGIEKKPEGKYQIKGATTKPEEPPKQEQPPKPYNSKDYLQSWGNFASKSEMLRAMNDVAKYLGYEGKLVATDQDHKFSLGGKQYKASGTFNTVTKIITAYRGQVHVESFDKLMAHEIQHAKYHAVNGDTDGNKAIGKLINKQEFRDELYKTDGVSNYSREYWKSYDNTNPGDTTRSSWKFHQAVNETLAEIAATSVRTGSVPSHTHSGSALSPAWRSLYDTYVKEYDRMKGGKK